jgi:hypothetical protein
MDTIELRINLTEELVRELLWRALAPEGIVMTSTLSGAIAQQEALRDVTLDGYQLAGISVTVENGGMHAELSYTLPHRQAGAHQQSTSIVNPPGARK